MTKIENWELGLGVGQRPIDLIHPILSQSAPPMLSLDDSTSWIVMLLKPPMEQYLELEYYFIAQTTESDEPRFEDWHWLLPEISSELISIGSSQTFATFRDLRQALHSEGLWGGKCCAISQSHGVGCLFVSKSFKKILCLGHKNPGFEYFSRYFSEIHLAQLYYVALGDERLCVERVTNAPVLNNKLSLQTPWKANWVIVTNWREPKDGSGECLLNLSFYDPG
jgi:hypothetical protein